MVKKTLWIWDLDGCLVHTIPVVVRAANRIREWFGLPSLEEEEIRENMGGSLPTFLQRTLADAGVELGTALFDEAQRLYAGFYQDSLSRAGPYDGIPEVLSDSEDLGVTHVVLTNKTQGLAEDTLRSTNLLHHFIDVVGCDTFDVSKPDPAGLLELIRAHGGGDRNIAVMIGDSRPDVEAGQNAGVATVWVSYGYGGGVQPDITVDEPYELLTLLN